MKSPYSDSRDHQMWRRAVSRIEPHLVDPVVRPKFTIGKSTRVATAGSCFAQHISRKLGDIGFNHFVPEDGADLPARARRTRGFGVFSARFGNIYTVEQLLQLFEEVFDGREHHETAWQRPDGRFVDPYRPRVEPRGFGRASAVHAARVTHLRFVEEVFRRSELFVFTLGLTEAWRSRVDGAVFPLAPGVVAGEYDETRHEFHNFTVDEVAGSLTRFLERLDAVNPGVKVLLTVSPVPLIATHEDRHVLVSTTYSKSVLRVAAQMVADRFETVDYFPSYEIITGSPTAGRYYEDDSREVNDLGVAHAMRCFVANYVADARPMRPTVAAATARSAVDEPREIVCDEEEIDAAANR